MKTKQQFDISKRQKHAFDATVENVKQANTAMKAAQNWLLILGLAEMSFLGTLFLRDKFKNTCILLYIKLLLVVFLLAFLFFILGSILQYRHLLKSARFYNDISDDSVKNYLNKGITKVDEEPNNLKLPEMQIRSNECANIFFSLAFSLIFISTIAIIFLIMSV